MASMNAVGKKTLRRVIGKNSRIEKTVRRRIKASRTLYRRLKSRLDGQYFEENLALFWQGERKDHRVGIYMKGSCDLPSVFSTIPAIRQELNGRCCMARRGIISESRSDVLLQTLKELPDDVTRPIAKKLRLRPGYFVPELFEPSFEITGPAGVETFPKDAIMLSIAADVVRTIYRHKETGVLVDPGGWWLSASMKNVLSDLERAKWMKANFESIGKISVEDFFDNYSRILTLLRERTSAQVMVFNVLTVEPGSSTHNYQFIRDPHSMRRREFDLALADLSRKFGFSIIDVDRILKRTGILEAQVDFAHFPPNAYEPIGKEVFRILHEREVIKSR
jgi:hypothetical protein